MEYLRGVVERITFKSEETGYAVLRCAVKGYSDLVTVVGTIADPHVGSVLVVAGEWKMDARYGRQFAMEHYEEALPATVYGIEKYLGSGLVKGIGPKFSKKIVQKFGKDTLDVIEQHPDWLLQIPGIGEVRVNRIRESWEEQKEIKNIMLFLQSHDVSTSHATKIFKTYGSDSISVVTENPYRMADDIWGIGFQTADTIAQKLGIEKDRPVRLRSGLLYTLNKLANDGHCYGRREQLLKAASETLGTEQGKLETVLDEMLSTQDVIQDGDAIYLPPFYYAETGCAALLLQLLQQKRTLPLPADEVMNKLQANLEVRYDSLQLEAIRTAIQSNVMVLTGGPGTGKTTTTLGIIRACRIAGLRILLAAPTGRAAKRMSEATGMEAKTIHRLLEFKPPEGYQRNGENPLEGDVLILDECSMIDLLLMYNLLKAVPEHMSLILVGDIDQLPSVGAGNVLKDIIQSEQVPVVRLTRIFRQAQGSQIIMNAHRINQGRPIENPGGKDCDFFFLSKEKEEIPDAVVQYVGKNLPVYYHVDPIKSIQVLTPMQKGPSGAANLNQMLQQALNPSGPCLRRGGVQYRLKDKVMQIRNNYDKEVFNGDIGTVSRVDLENQELGVTFDEREISYDVTELDELVLSYAITIHKSQGSEFPIVVMPISWSHYMMLQRNLLYTGVTRAKQVLLIIGEKKAVAQAIHNKSTAQRNTKLAQRLQQGTGARENVKVGVSRSALFQRLRTSEFRSRFALNANDKAYVQEHGMETIRQHACDFVAKRLAPAVPEHDGKQTPMQGHPVFVAQHATGTCCRECLEKWHYIPRGTPLTAKQQAYVVDVIMDWIAQAL